MWNIKYVQKKYDNATIIIQKDYICSKENFDSYDNYFYEKKLKSIAYYMHASAVVFIKTWDSVYLIFKCERTIFTIFFYYFVKKY